jgi:hypothetical protein
MGLLGLEGGRRVKRWLGAAGDGQRAAGVSRGPPLGLEGGRRRWLGAAGNSWRAAGMDWWWLLMVGGQQQWLRGVRWAQRVA